MEAYGVSIVLSTATQPALAAREDFAEGLGDVREIIKDRTTLYQGLQRVEYQIEIEELWPWSRVADVLKSEQQAMVVLNTIRDAMSVLDELEGGSDVYHLSTQLCGAHRKVVLNEVQRIDSYVTITGLAEKLRHE